MPPKPVNGSAVQDFAAALLSAPGLQLSQRLALEAARFSAQRMRAYADQMEALTHCANASDVVNLQTKFFTKLGQDYVGEVQAVRDMIAAAPSENRPAV